MKTNRLKLCSRISKLFWGITLLLSLFNAELLFTQPSEIFEIPRGRVGFQYYFVLPAVGGLYPYYWAHIGGILPPGISLSQEGELKGKFECAGHYTFTVQVIDSRGDEDKTVVKIIVEHPLTELLPLKLNFVSLTDAVLDQPYGVTLAAEGGYLPYEWTIEGTLPKGLQIDSRTGEITGTPEEAGKSKFLIRVQDAQAIPAITEKEVSLEVLKVIKEGFHFDVVTFVIICVIVVAILFLSFTYFEYEEKKNDEGNQVPSPNDSDKFGKSNTKKIDNKLSDIKIDTDKSSGKALITKKDRSNALPGSTSIRKDDKDMELYRPWGGLKKHFVDCKQDELKIDTPDGIKEIKDIELKDYKSWVKQLDPDNDMIFFRLHPNSLEMVKMAKAFPDEQGVKSTLDVV